jgi:hydrogenase-4 component E
MNMQLASQINSLLAALILLTAFGLVVQRRMNGLLHLFAWQGFLLAVSTAIVGYVGGVHDLYISSVLTLSMKVVLLPYILLKLMRKLKIHREVETVVNIPATMLMGIVLVIFSYHLTAPIRELSTLVTRSTLAVALATVMLFAATSATYGMPLVVELGVALDLLIAAFIFGMFFFHISTTFDSLDVDQMARLKEED